MKRGERPMGMKNIFYDYEKDPAQALQLTL